MKPEEAKAALARTVKRAWPNLAKASELPFPDYWKAVTEWLTFHAPHIGDVLMQNFIDEFVTSAKEAEKQGQSPDAPKIPNEVREIWRKVEKKHAWEHAYEMPGANTRPRAGRLL